MATPGPERRAWRTEAEWTRLSERIAAGDSVQAVSPAARSGRRSGTLARVGAIAAAALIVVVGTVRLIRHSTAVPQPPTRDYRTAAGERLTVRFSDSTTATLAPASTLRVTESASRREVSLSGLAFFHVAHDARRPFVVHAGNAVARDVGTEFTVRAYRGERSVEVAVIQGEVALAPGSGDGVSHVVALRAGDVGTVHDGTASADARPTSVAMYTAWVDGRLSFDNAPLSSVASELERWFDVSIRIDDAALGRRRVTAVYNNAQLEGVLTALSATLHLQYAKSGRSIVLSSTAAP